MGYEEGLQHCSGGPLVDATSPVAGMQPDSPGWYSWQFCEASMSPQSDPSMSPHWQAEVDNEANLFANAERFGGAGWDYSNGMSAFNDAADTTWFTEHRVGDR